MFTAFLIASLILAVTPGPAVICLLNLKTALFFAAFLPQLIEPSCSLMAQSK